MAFIFQKRRKNKKTIILTRSDKITINNNMGVEKAQKTSFEIMRVSK
jgi:hypothetical protein